MRNLSKTSQKFKILFQILFYLVPILTILYWMFGSGAPSWLVQTGFGISAAQVTLTPLTRFLAALVSLLIPIAIIMYGLWQLIQLFSHYERREIFTLSNVKRYRNLAYTLFAWVIGGMIYEGLISAILTVKTVGYHVIKVGFSSSDLTVLIVGAILFVIAAVMAEGYQLAEDEKNTV